MGLFDKLRGKKADAPSTSSQEPAPTAGNQTPQNGAHSPATPQNIPPRRERSKPTTQDASSAHSSPDQIPTPTASPFAMEIPPIDPNQENADLLIAIKEIIAADNPATREKLYQSLLTATLYLVTLNNETEGTGPLELKGGEQLQLATIPAADGKIFLPAFTDVKRLSVSLPPKARYIPVPMRMLCQMFLQGNGEGIVINPGQPPSGVVTKPEAQILASGAMPKIDANGQLTGEMPQQIQIKISKPETPPDESFINAIQDKARSIEEIEEVHIFMAGIENQPMKLVIGMLLREGMEPDQMHPAFEAVGKAAMDAKGSTGDFDMMPLNREVVDTIEPMEGLIYKKA